MIQENEITRKADLENEIPDSNIGGTPLPSLPNTNLKNTYTVDDFKDQRTTEDTTREEDRNLIQFYSGGSVLRMKQTKVEPLENHTVQEDRPRGDRRSSIGFSNKSRNHLLTKLGQLDKNKIDKDRVLFITLTLDGDDHIKGLMSPTEFSKCRNNFLTQMRQRLKGLKYFYVWRTERQDRGSLHLHMCLFGLKYLNQWWVQDTWSRIVLGKNEFNGRKFGNYDKTLLRTEVEKARNWKETGQYFSKVLGYVSKTNEGEVEKVKKVKENMRPWIWSTLSKVEQQQTTIDLKLLSMKRQWGIGGYSVYWEFVSPNVWSLNQRNYYELRRRVIGYIKGQWYKSARKKGGEFDYKKWKAYKKYLLTGHATMNFKTTKLEITTNSAEVKVFMEEETVERLWMYVLARDFNLDRETLESKEY